MHASGTVTVGGVSVAVATNGYGAHDVSNAKTWVDARITIGQSGVNQVGDPHTFTVFVEKNNGLTGWQPAAGVDDHVGRPASARSRAAPAARPAPTNAAATAP